MKKFDTPCFHLRQKTLFAHVLPYEEKIDYEAFVYFFIAVVQHKCLHHPKLFSERRGTSLVFEAVYSPALNICDRYLLQKQKRQLRHQNFKSHTDLSTVSRTRCISFLNTFLHQIDKLFNYCQLVIEAGGEYMSDENGHDTIRSKFQFLLFFHAHVSTIENK